MYKNYYGFSQKPFSLLPNPDFLYLAKNHSIALSILDFGIMNESGFTVITGEIGAGKTTLVRYLLNQLNVEELTVGLVSNTLRSFGELLQWILFSLGQHNQGKTKVELYQVFVEFLLQEYAEGRRVILIIDEAQNMDVETLEELRILSNINADQDQILQIILIGQPQLRETLTKPELEQFAQRIVADYHLEPLSNTEVIEYIRHRLQVVGGDPNLFDFHAMNYIAYFSKGVPRLVNMICDLALVYGFVEQTKIITSDIVTEVINDKMRSGLTPMKQAINLFKPSATSQLNETVVSP